MERWLGRGVPVAAAKQASSQKWALTKASVPKLNKQLLCSTQARRRLRPQHFSGARQVWQGWISLRSNCYAGQGMWQARLKPKQFSGDLKPSSA